jgi:hypothetical protein
VEHGLLRCDFGDGRKDAQGIAGEEDDVARVFGGEAGDFGVFDMLDGVGAASE